MATVDLAAAQPNAVGRELHRLTPFAGAIYAAYGDYNGNTGPIHAAAFDTTTLAIRDEATFKTEETWSLRVFTGSLWVPYFDPQGGNEATWHYARHDGTTWHLDQPLTDPFVTGTPEHVLGMVENADGLWFFGSAYGVDPSVGGAACIWRSTDGGATWTVSLLLDQPADTGYNRFYMGVPLDGDEIVAVLGDVAPAPRYRWDGASWVSESSVTAVLTDYVLFNHNGTVFALAWASGKPTGAVAAGAPHVLTAIADEALIPAIEATLPARNVIDAAVDGDVLYLITSDMVLRRLRPNGTSMRALPIDGSFPVTSLAVDSAGGYLYFGTSDSRILRAPIPA